MNSYRQALYTGIIRIATNLLMIAAIFVAMYQASRSAAAAELVFCAWFFGMIVPLWSLCFLLTRWVRRRYPAEFQSLISLPGRGECLVRWRVADAPASPERIRR